MRSGPGEARTILLLHIISARPSKQRLMVRTFLKVYMELGSYFVSARTNKRRHHHLQTRRETEAHFTAAGMSSQRNHSDSFRFKRAVFYQSLKSKVGFAAAKAAALRININVEGCDIVAAPVHAPSRAPLLLPLLLSHNLPLPRSLVRDGQPSPHRPRLVVSRSTCPQLPPFPHANSFGSVEDTKLSTNKQHTLYQRYCSYKHT